MGTTKFYLFLELPPPGPVSDTSTNASHMLMQRSNHSDNLKREDGER